MGNLGRNIQFGLRMLLRNKGFSAIAMVVLALGIGPNVAIFSIVWATFLAPLPYLQPDRIVVIWNMTKGERGPTPVDEFLQFQAQSKSFSHLELVSWSLPNHITGPDHIQEEIAGGAATPGFYSRYLGIPMELGRDLLPSEGLPGKDQEIVITHKLWQERYGSDPRIVGKSIPVNDRPYTVVGVVAPGMGDRIPMQFLVPTPYDPAGHYEDAGGISGRLKPGVTIAQAQAELTLIDKRFVATHSGEALLNQWSISVEPLHNAYLDKKLASRIWMLLGAVCFVLLIACANLANLLLARGASRQQEIAVRTALGASKGQVFAQLITESLTLSLLGGAAGIGLGFALMKLSIVLMPDYGNESETLVSFNLPVLCFAVLVTLVAGAISGWAPALRAMRLNLSDTLKQGSRTATGRGQLKTQAVLVAAEFALALTLLAGAGMTLHSFWNLTHVDLGFRTDHIFMGWLNPPIPDSDPGSDAQAEQVSAQMRLLLNNIRSLPGVQDAALASSMPMEGHSFFYFSIAGQPVAQGHKPVADLEIVSPSYFSTFGVQLMRGRFLDDSDRRGHPRTVMVNQNFVNRFLRGVDPLSQRLRLWTIDTGPDAGITPEWQIVGVFHNVRNAEHLNEDTDPQIFVSHWQRTSRSSQIAVRTRLDPAHSTRTIRAAIAQSLPGYTLEDTRIMEKSIDDELINDRFGMVLFGAFAVLALLLSALGIYGVMSFAVAQRRHEIGLRMALGAQRGDVVRMILIDGMKLALWGVGIGVAGVYVLGRVMHSTLYGVNTVDAASFSAVAVFLFAVALLASYLPARRSARIDPMIALRQE